MRLFSDAAAGVDDPFLRRAFVLAENGRGATAPNPMVGCVLVRDGEIVGEGWHAKAGEAHAEVDALAQAGERARGATAYVTLEPCNHVGRTGACSSALADAGVSAVVVGMPDPNPHVEGGGAEALRAAGIAVRFADDPSPFEEQNEAWLKSVTAGLPWVTAKVALSLDGHASLREGERAVLSGPGCTALTMRLRTAVDAVLVGAGTLAVDDPALTVRDEADTPAESQPLRVVLSRETLPPADARIFTDGLGPALALVSSEAPDPGCEALARTGVRVARYDARGGLGAAFGVLARLDVMHLLIEAGPRLLEALWRAHMLDDLVLYHTGGMAGATAPPLFAAATHGSGGRVMSRMQAVEAGVAGLDAATVWRACPGWVCDLERE